MRKRLDELLLGLGLAPDLQAAHGLIRAGRVLVDEEIADKPGSLIRPEKPVRVKPGSAYVSRGGLKLKEALDHFHIDPTGRICIDIGVSTGGFTDCLLQHDARTVYGVDVGYGQIAWSLRQDPRVILLERFNARKLTRQEIPDPISLAVIDVSFISLSAVILPLLPLFPGPISIIGLIKPQFELPREAIGKGGIVKDPLLHQQAIDAITSFANEQELQVGGTVPSPIRGAKGNKEFLIHLTGRNHQPC